MFTEGGSRGGDTKEEIIELGTVLLKDFIYERVRRHGDKKTEVTRAQLGGSELCDPNQKRLARCLQQIGDELDGNMELQRMINCSSLSPTKDVFVKVAVEIFADGKFNWGRVVALFYFACRLIIKALLTSVPDIIKTIIDWTIGYLRENVLNWIREQGGWEGIRSYFGTPTWQMVAVFLAGVITTVIVVRKM
ncbi:apoptosis regulator BAX-like isoform X2 [Corythoichthys intestinalis]|uniref:apoptosis regulator BAX-like isoform X2 n=1 Tax=Corythoichthys intestinalis TaxID=161448 RepID=UPI0025A5A182|nr:apoptosis regulator BAX-like isoform X2 [Corythoichthys intestinalis]